VTKATIVFLSVFWMTTGLLTIFGIMKPETNPLIAGGIMISLGAYNAALLVKHD